MPNPARRGRPGLGAVQVRDAADDGVHDPAAAGGVGRRERREEDIDEHDRVAEREGAPAERAHDPQGDAPAEGGSLVAEAQHERGEGEPDRRALEARQRPLERLRPRIEPGAGELLGTEERPPGERHNRRHADEPTAEFGTGSRTRAASTPAKTAK